MIFDTTLVHQLEKVLPEYLLTRRWFRSKALTISHLHVSDTIETDGFLILLLSINYAQGGNDLYLLPVTSVKNPASEQLNERPIITFQTEEGESVGVFDALLSPFFRTSLFRTITSSSTSGALTSKSSVTVPPPEGIVESFVSKAEQSNTSIIYGKDYILKLFRKLESGVNPDIEMGAFLTAQGFKNTPAMLATLEYKPSANQSFFAGILQEFVPNEGDAWKYTLGSLEAFYKRSTSTALASPELLGDYVDSAKLLGIRTAQMHATLASSTTDPDFTPESFTAADAETLANEISTQAQTALALLNDKLPSLSIADQQLAQHVLDLKSRVKQRFAALSVITTSARRIRYHGDYHLGQVLYTGSDFMIIDFEGEPARPLSQRRAKALALRDVAGMVRSFQYAAYSGSSPEQADLAALWYKQASKIYLDAYFSEAESQPFLPSTPEQREFFLDAFLLQKALYEVQYELNNRPAWVGIPLRGILSLVHP